MSMSIPGNGFGGFENSTPEISNSISAVALNATRARVCHTHPHAHKQDELSSYKEDELSCHKEDVLLHPAKVRGFLIVFIFGVSLSNHWLTIHHFFKQLMCPKKVAKQRQVILECPSSEGWAQGLRELRRAIHIRGGLW